MLGKKTKLLLVMTRKLFIVLLILTGLTSCLNEIDLPNNFEPKINVECILVPEREVWVKLSSTFPVNTEPNNIPIVDAEVNLYSNDTHIGQVHHSENGLYILDGSIIEGETYTLKVSCKGFHDVEATTTVPLSTPVKVNREYKEYQRNDRMLFDTKINVTFPDSNRLLYYGLTIYKVERWIFGDQEDINYIPYSLTPNGFFDFFDESYSLFNCDNVFTDFTEPDFIQELRIFFPNDSEQSFGEKSTIFLSNEGFLGCSHTWSERFDELYSIDQETYVNIYEISPELYKTFLGVAAQNEIKRRRFAALVSPYNAIKGGTGYFGAVTIHRIDIRDYSSPI